MKHCIVILALLFCVVSSEWILRDLKVPRVRSTAAQVGNKIYIAGGEIEGGSSTSSIEVLNTDNFEFEQVDISLPSPRQRFTAVPIGSKIYFSGGSQNSIDVYDTSSNSWTVLSVPSLQSVNITFAGSLGGQLVYVTSDGNALFINTESSQVTDSLRLCNYTSPYSAYTRTFLQIPEYDGKLYAPCGGDILFFNANFVQKLGARPESGAVVNHMLVWAPKSILCIADSSATQFFFYKINSSSWDARLLSGRRKDYSIATVGTNVYVMGGSTGQQTNGTDYTFGFFFNAPSMSLSFAFDLKVPRSQMTPFSTSNAALFIGGIAASGEYMSTIDIIYEGELKAPGTPTTTQSPTSQTGLSGSTTLVLNFITAFVVIAVCLLN